MLTSFAKSTKVIDYKDFNWTLNENDSIKYPEIINFERAATKDTHHCVMCGTVKGPNCVIPNQNKDVCKTCDSSYWLLRELNVLVKFCKGCKKFSALQDFDEKPEASKCGKCRKRGRQNYYSRKQDEDEVGKGHEGGAERQGVGAGKGKQGKGGAGNSRSKKDKFLSQHIPEVDVNTFNKTPQLHKMHHKGGMNTLNDLSGETDESSASLNITSSTSSECPSPPSYHISNHHLYSQTRSGQNPHPFTAHHHQVHSYHQNHSFSSPSFNDNSELDILGFNPYDHSAEIDSTAEQDTHKHHDLPQPGNASQGHASGQGNPFNQQTSGSGVLKIPFPFRPCDSSGRGAGGLPPHQFKSTPSRAAHSNGISGPNGVSASGSGQRGNEVCPDTGTSVISCSSQLSDSAGGGTYFSNSYLWADSLKEIERNSVEGSGRVQQDGRGDGHGSSIGGSHTSSPLINNPMSCFQMPTGHPSATKKPHVSSAAAISSSRVKASSHTAGGKAQGGNGLGVAADSSTITGTGRASGGEGGVGVVMDRKDSRDSLKTSGSSSKNSSLSSIGSAGCGFPMNHFGDLGGVGIAGQANTPGLLLSITPQGGGAFTPHGTGAGGGGFEMITPFSGTPMFSHSPFDSINTPDSNWKWDPSANALMNLASLSAEVLTNTPPVEDNVTATSTSAIAASTITVPTADTPSSIKHEPTPVCDGAGGARKCNSDPGKATCSTATHSNSLPQPHETFKALATPGAAEGDGATDEDISAAAVAPGGSGASCRALVVSDDHSHHPHQADDPCVNPPLLNEREHIHSSQQPTSPFPHFLPDDPNIYLIALDSDRSLELSPPLLESKKRSFQRESELKEMQEKHDGSSCSTYSSAVASKAQKKLRL